MLAAMKHFHGNTGLFLILFPRIVVISIDYHRRLRQAPPLVNGRKMDKSFKMIIGHASALRVNRSPEHCVSIRISAGLNFPTVIDEHMRKLGGLDGIE